MTRIVEPPVLSPSSPRDAAAPSARETTPTSPPSSGGAVPWAGMPLRYVVASAIFLAIALVGFGLWLAVEVITL